MEPEQHVSLVSVATGRLIHCGVALMQHAVYGENDHNENTFRIKFAEVHYLRRDSGGMRLAGRRQRYLADGRDKPGQAMSGFTVLLCLLWLTEAGSSRINIFIETAT